MEDNKQFKEWWYNKRQNEDINNKISWNQFNELPFSMQWGVYLEFFDSVGLYISILFSEKDSYAYTIETDKDYLVDDIHVATRPEAQTAAKDKAFEILNE